MDNNEGCPEPQDCWLYYIVSLKEKYKTEEGRIRIHPEMPVEGVVSADLTDPDVFCVVHGTGSMVRMLQEHKEFYEKKEYSNEFANFMANFAQQNLENKQ
jgi:hypothetical protein